MLSRLDTIPERERRTDGQTDNLAILLSRASNAELTRDKNELLFLLLDLLTS